jgi:peroxiredoxin
MEQVYQAYREQGFVILAVNATNQDNEADAVAFREQYGLTFPVLLDRDGQVGRLYNLRALPSTYFVGKDGVIDDVVIGGPMAEALLLSRVDRLLEKDP